MAHDLTGERLKAAQKAQQERDNGKVLGDQLWRFLMAHEPAVRALVAEAESPPQYSAAEEERNEVLIAYLHENADVLVALFDDYLKRHPRKDEPAAAPAAA